MSTLNTLVSSRDLGLTPSYEGKVRDLFDLGDELLIVATDRISAYDVIMKEPVPGKGAMLTGISVEWFRIIEEAGLVKHHLISADWRDFPEPFRREELGGRSMLVRKTERFDLECVVRGYLVGSGWKDYGDTGAVCGITLSPGLQEAAKLEPAIFTPATKADEGHDLNVGPEDASAIVGTEWFDTLKAKSLELYRFAEEYARARGIIIADTKMEFGHIDGELILIDEVFTPDSSRFWDERVYAPGSTPDSFDKQILRKHLDDVGFAREGEPPTLPAELVERIYGRYAEILEILFPGAGGTR
jgi:phosphoribosylaminoimidazole-succinocarboxamide synthase